MPPSLEKRKSLVFGIAVICAAVIATFLLAATKQTPKRLPPPAPAPALVKVIYAEPKSYAPLVTTTAKVSAKRAIDLTAQISGVVIETESHFARGAQVTQDDLLVIIDDQDYQTALARAEFELAKAEEALAIEKGAARQALREWRDLKNDEANDLFLRRPQVASAEANLRSAKSNLQQAKTNLERTKIRAPFSGQITDIEANIGQYITPGNSLARLVSTGYLEIAAPLTTNEINRLGLQRSQPSESSLQRNVEVIYNYGFDESNSVTGKLVRFDLVADDETQVRHAIIEIKNDSTPIHPGELVSVNIPGESHPAAIWLPEQALYQRSEVITVVDDRLTPIEIKLLEARDGKILAAGIEAGTPIVVERPFWSGPGTIVSINTDKPNREQVLQDKNSAEPPSQIIGES